MKIAGLADKMIRVGVFAPAGVIAGCVACCIGVINDGDTVTAVDALLILVSFALIAVGVIAALCTRKWALAAGGVFSGVVCRVPAVCNNDRGRTAPRRRLDVMKGKE